jgi:hypothetical protein
VDPHEAGAGGVVGGNTPQSVNGPCVWHCAEGAWHRQQSVACDHSCRRLLWLRLRRCIPPLLLEGFSPGSSGACLQCTTKGYLY